MTEEEVREALAAYAHEAWSGWMQYVFEKSEHAVRRFHNPYVPEPNAPEAIVVIPGWAVERWTRQMNTAYQDLPEEEKESDRKEADRMLAIIGGTNTNAKHE